MQYKTTLISSEMCGILKTDSFQLLPIGCGKLLQPDQWLALVEEDCTALKATDVIFSSQAEVIDRFKYKGLCLIAVGHLLGPIFLALDLHARLPSL